MTVHVTPPPSNVVAIAPLREPPHPTNIQRLLLPLVLFGGGDRRVFRQPAAEPVQLVTLGIVSLIVNAVSSVIIAISTIFFFEFNQTASTIVWSAAAAFGCAMLMVNQTLFHGQFHAYGSRLLMTMRPANCPLPPMIRPNRTGPALRVLFGLFLATVITVPGKLAVTKVDTTHDIRNASLAQNARPSKNAQVAVDGKIRQATERAGVSSAQVAALAFEKSVVDVGQLGGSVPTPPANTVVQIPPEIMALAQQAEEQHRRLRQTTALRDNELALVRQHDQDARNARRQRGGDATARAAAAETRRNQAQQRANAAGTQIRSIETEIGKIKPQLDTYRESVMVRLEIAQRTQRDDERRLRELEGSRDQQIAQLTLTSEGYKEFSEGIFGRIESVHRIVTKSTTNAVAFVVMVLLFAAWDLLPMMIKSAIRVPSYAMAIARESHQAFVSEIRASAAADAELIQTLGRANTDVSAFRKEQRQQTLEWYAQAQPIWRARLSNWFGLPVKAPPKTTA